MLRQHDLVVSTNDLNPVNYADSHEGSLQPCFYKDKSVDVFVTSPYFAVLDLPLPVMVQSAKVAVVVHGPGHYLYDPTEPRQHHFFYFLIERMAVILGLPKRPVGRRCAWLIIARSPSVLKGLLQSVPALPLMFGMQF